MSSGSISDDDDYTVTSDCDEYDYDEEEPEMEYELNDDIGFNEVVADKRHSKAHEIDYTVMPIADILAAQSGTSCQVAGILGISVDQAKTLLRSFKWNKERLIERYMDDPEKVLANAGVMLDDVATPTRQRPNGFVCMICFDDDSSGPAFGLQCGHVFCQTCYEQYLTQKIAEEGECRKILCPESGCSVIADEQTICKVVKQPVIENNKFCFGCGQCDHQPAPCGLVKLWQKKCADDSETANWISTHTKECGKCQSTIEKNGGCNHMTCRKCRHEFCWVCMGPWLEHGSSFYNCNRYEDTLSADARDQQARSRASLERYLHYYNRFANHEQSAKLDRDLYAKTERKMDAMQRTSDLSWIEVQFLKDAVDVLTSCRMTLRWTYAFAFYLVKDNQTQLFEDNQRDLEVAVEALSELLENPLEREKIAELRAQVLDKAVYVDCRRDVLLEDAAKGLADGRWQFFVDVANPAVN
ncbi:hypothetical protein BGX28_000893 [Mortierella sp. GBA30]|nr:hypothetical protein BGX28_000893 [Mortierella sp. GBA30]